MGMGNNQCKKNENTFGNDRNDDIFVKNEFEHEQMEKYFDLAQPEAARFS